MADLEKYLDEIKERSKSQIGYCYNGVYDYSPLFPLLHFTINNLGDPFISSLYGIDSREFECEVLDYFAELYQLPDYWGYITAGGTEGNLFGLLLGREVYPAGILYAADSAHYSIAKAAHMFKIPLVTIASQENGEMNYDDLKHKLDPKHPAILVATMGTTFHGATDDIDQIEAVLKEKNISDYHIHCDAALGGMILPFLDPDKINFRKNIQSLCISGHKFIGTPFPCGIFIARQGLSQKMRQHIEYIGSKDSTLLGSRNGHAALFLWYAISQRKDQFQEEVRSCIKQAHYFYETLSEKNKACLQNPNSNIVVFPRPSDAFSKHWHLSIKGEQVHIAVMQQHTKEFIDRFIAAYLEE